MSATSRAGDADLAAVGAVLAEPARAKVLLALADGRSLPAGVLAGEAGVAASTASHHLARLVGAGLVQVTERGRYRYFCLAGPHVAALIEATARIAPAQPVTSLRQGTRAYAVRYARRCYDHLAGRLGVAVTDALRERGVLVSTDGRVDLDRMTGPRPAGGVIDPVEYSVSETGVDTLASIGVTARAGEIVRCCVDWTEQRHHIAGWLGRSLLDRMLSDRWLTRRPADRAVRVTSNGQTQLGGLGVIVPAL